MLECTCERYQMLLRNDLLCAFCLYKVYPRDARVKLEKQFHTKNPLYGQVEERPDKTAAAYIVYANKEYESGHFINYRAARFYLRQELPPGSEIILKLQEVA